MSQRSPRCQRLKALRRRRKTSSAGDASEKVAQAIGQPAEDVRPPLDDASRWTPVESVLRGLLKAVSDANLVRRQRAAVVAMQAYGIGQQLTRDPANAVLVAPRARGTPSEGASPPQDVLRR